MDYYKIKEKCVAQLRKKEFFKSFAKQTDTFIESVLRHGQIVEKLTN